MIHERTGLVLDAYFSGSKVAGFSTTWPGTGEGGSGAPRLRHRDTWLVYKLRAERGI
jgi:glycerol kinase